MARMASVPAESALRATTRMDTRVSATSSFRAEWANGAGLWLIPGGLGAYAHSERSARMSWMSVGSASRGPASGGLRCPDYPKAADSGPRPLRGDDLLGVRRLDLDCTRVQRAEIRCVQGARDGARGDLGRGGGVLDVGGDRDARASRCAFLTRGRHPGQLAEFAPERVNDQSDAPERTVAV
jgi:hypothetical protein